jgi:hypothetical protein
MSVFGPNQVEEPMIGNAAAAETTIATFIASATDKELAVLGAGGGAVVALESFKVLQKADAIPGGYEFSDVVKPSKVEKVILATYAAEVNKAVSVSAFAPLAANYTYALEVRLFNDGGTLSPENFATITGYYVSGASAPSATDVSAGLVSSLQANLTKRGGGELTVVDAGAGVITIAGQVQTVVPGKIIGKQIEFEVIAKVFDNAALIGQENITTNAVTVTNENFPGTGTGKYAVNLEWFAKGYKYEVYRQTGYPADFATPYYASIAGVYNVIHIKYKDSRISPSVEEQPKVMTILINKVTDTLANNASTNTILTSIRTALTGTGVSVPADLAVV